MRCELHRGDSLELLRGFAEASVDSIVTDPPYELGFMGKSWDRSGVANNVALWREALRVLKPGGHLLAFSGTRTYHRMVCAIEDAGFEVRDQLAWVYGSGFPKSHNGDWGGTALKPAWEPIVMARKALIGTVEANWLAYGTGALNIDGCRVHSHDSEGYEYSVQRMASGADQNRTGKTHQEGVVFEGRTKDGRWPANLMHDGSDEVVGQFPESKSGTETQPRGSGGMWSGESNTPCGPQYADKGSAARFFYSPKASKKDREDGLDEFTATHRVNGNKWTDQDYRVKTGERPLSSESGPRKNVHPTVKPTELMRYLCRLVTPAGGNVLDLFTGSGSTGKAAVLEGFEFVGLEKDEDDKGNSLGYIDIAAARILAAGGDVHVFLGIEDLV